MAKLKLRMDNPARVIAKGATGVAITAGVVAAGAMLADRQVRNKLTKSIGQGIKTIKEITSESMERIEKSPAKFPAVAHRVSVRGKKRRR